MKKGAIIDALEITGISAEGKGVGRIDGQVVFVKETVPGDVVKAKIVSKRKKFLEGIREEVIKTSADRIKPFCEHFGWCGGCKWQHMSYDAQLRYKQAHIAQNLRKLSGLKLPGVKPVLASKKTTFYRNKLEYTFSNFRWLTKEEIDSGEDHIQTGLGFHIPKRFDKILNINKCWLQKDPSNEIRLAIKEFADEHNIPYFDLKKQEGFLRNLVIRTASTGEVMVILQTACHDKEWLDLILNFTKKKFPVITALLYVINEKGNDSFHDLEVKLFSGKDHIMEEMSNLKFRIGPKSFYQTNSAQAHELYKIVAEYAGLTGGELVYDLYTGTGTIANFIAGKAKKVIGIECATAAIEDAKLNSEINGITNTAFFAGDMKDMLVSGFVRQHGKPDVIITDPPRAGMHPKVTRFLTDLKVRRIVYVSCNPATQARDLEVLSQAYDVASIQPVDMFPQTQHIENVILMKHRNP
ncbi:MAG: 23S rRNA (uracil(1939)-C(5))-methyltransferase RlmD [Ekhidna sp.]|nr:23S rRNA (uracil(1939)-C(5))-methyltransferase RlmD [Ekhidna sp.]